MIEVSHLTKRYGNHKAVDDLSFTIPDGTIYGFLGPNGAGKSTTMNIMTGCLGAGGGDVKIDGHSVLDEPESAKRQIGYLPEQPPLYTDMTPKEYLNFVAAAKGLKGQELVRQVRSVADRTGIIDVQDRLIRNLSKGYRQRVGIAQALLADPKIIILDEPTVGLDPKQIIEIRELIRDLGKTHTVVLSSHVLSEVQAVCDHIMIISHGRLVACDTAENLTKLFNGSALIRLEGRMTAEEMKQILSGVPGTGEPVITGTDGTASAEVRMPGEADIREALFMAFAAAKRPLTELALEKASLEDVFLELTESDVPPVQAEPEEKTEESAETEGEAEA